MNEQSDDAAPATDDPDRPARVVPDNYDRYLEDEYGYEYGARDTLPIRVLESHDRLLDDPEGGLENRDFSDLDDFERLGLARGLADAGDLEAFDDVLDHLIESEADHEAVRYPEIPLFGAHVAMRHGAADRALEWLRRGADRWPDRARPALLFQARIALRRDDRDRAAKLYQSLTDEHPEDPELAFEIAEDLAEEGYDDWASEWVSRARDTADRIGDTSIPVDLDVLEARLQQG